MKSKARILIIDDDASIRFILEKTLEAEGYEVKSASDGEEAIDLATANPFDLIMIDLIMPRKSGFQTIVALQEIQPDIGIIAMSGGGWNRESESYLRVAGRLGACRTLAKPFDKATLMAAIEGEIAKQGPSGQA
jgi:DNA-binding response OmpR family regulator